MSDFKANTDVMRNGAGVVLQGANSISQTTNRLSGLNSQLGNNYQGQLRDKVEPILSRASNEGTRLSSRSQEFGESLNLLAADIDKVMQENNGAATSALTTPAVSGSSIAKFFGRINQATWSVAAAIMTWVGFERNAIVGKTTIIVNPIPVPNSSSTPTYPKNQSNYSGYALIVPVDDNRRTLDEVPNPERNSDAVALYPRGNGNNSNCTWYTAAAVGIAYGIPLNSGIHGKTGKFTRSLGKGGEWALSAHAAIDPNDPNHSKYEQYQPYISSVDNHPEPGAVYSTPGTNDNPTGHVMFVEQAQLVEIKGTKSWQVVVSEEIWGGTDAYSGAVGVQIPGHPDVKRWTRTITIPADSNGQAESSGKFIHFKDAKQ